MATNKEKYALWAAQQVDMPLFMQAWWMDAVCAGKQWDVILVENALGEILGAMPYLLRSRLGVRYIVMPQQTQIGGIWVDSAISGNQWQVAEVCRQIVEQLDGLKLAYYYQHFPTHSYCVEPMRALGFSTKERVTYRVEELGDAEAMVARFSKNKKRQLQKAKDLIVDKSMTAEAFYRYHLSCLAEQKKAISYTREFFLVLERKLSRLGQCAILAIKDQQGNIHAAAFLVWDRKKMYYLIPCYSLAYGHSGAGALLVLEAMKLCREKHLTFDFEGSIVPSIAEHYRQFGSSPCTYYSVEKCYHPLFRLALWINSLRNLRYR